MRTNNPNARLIALARAAGALAGVAFDATDRTPEQATAFAKFTAACAAANIDAAATYASAAQADTRGAKRKPSDAKPGASAKPESDAKPGAKPGAKAKPEPEQPSKPHAGDKRADYDARVALVNELRATASRLYNGPSLAVRSNPKRIALAVYLDLFAAPKHRTTLAKLSVRDESGLFTILQRGDKRGGFDPVALNLDSGIFSRLCSVGFIERAGDTFALTAPALDHAKLAAKRAA